MRYAFKAVDFGASIVFMAMCAGAFWRHFHNDVVQQLQRPKLPLVRIRRRLYQQRSSSHLRGRGPL
jgi:hypothetical protein